MAKKISFSDCIYRYFDTVFWKVTEDYVIRNSEFRSLHGLADNVKIEFDGIIKKYVTVIRTEGTEVVFFVRILFSYVTEYSYTDDVEAICRWNIFQKDEGLTVGPLKHGLEMPRPECQFGDDLVPIVRKEEYGRMAELFLSKVFGDERVDDEGFMLGLAILERLGLRVMKIHLPECCTGRIVMADTKLKMVTPSGQIAQQDVNAGTILLDIDKAALMNNSLIASTLIHECVHWVFHRCAFELGRLYCRTDEGFTCMRDKTTEGSTAAAGNKFIEIQTLGIVPRIITPLANIRKEAEEVAMEVRNLCRNKAHGREMVLDELKNRHSVSTESMRRSLIDSGLDCFRSIKVFQDGVYLQSYCFDNGTLGKDETFDIPCESLSKLYQDNNIIRDLLNNGEYVYADGHLVKNDPKYVTYRNEIDPQPTEYALLHATDCFMKFKVSYPKSETMVFFDYGLSRMPKAWKRTYDAIYDSRLSKEDRFKARAEWENYKKEWYDCLRDTFGQTLRAMMDHFGKSGSFFDGKGISADQVYRICDSGNSPQLRTVVALGGLFNMPYEVFLRFVKLAGYDFFANKPEILKYKEFMDDAMIFKDISEFDNELIRSGLKPLSKPAKTK